MAPRSPKRTLGKPARNLPQNPPLSTKAALPSLASSKTSHERQENLNAAQLALSESTRHGSAAIATPNSDDQLLAAQVSRLDMGTKCVSEDGRASRPGSNAAAPAALSRRNPVVLRDCEEVHCANAALDPAMPVLPDALETAAAPAGAVAPVSPVSPLASLLPRWLVDDSGPSTESLVHAGFIREALDMAHLALKTNETPVGCVLVYRGRVIAKGMNATNVTRNGTRHAEYMAIGALLSFTAPNDACNIDRQLTSSEKAAGPLGSAKVAREQDQWTKTTASWGDVDPSDGHLYPYGQKLHPAPCVDKSVVAECVLYVTVEPCVMCASLLRQLGIRKVYFGAVNDKFGGTGGVFRIHVNSDEHAASVPSPAAVMGPATAESTILEGHGGNVERGYDAEGGWGRDEAVTLLRQFYVQENGRAPIPRKKEGRAARLAAMMERDGHAGGPMADVGGDNVEVSDSGDDGRDRLGLDVAAETT